MASKKYCPICDKQIHGRFCTTCMQFVKPCEHEVNYHLNEGHDPKDDPNCDYHGTTTTTYRDMPEMPRMESYTSSVSDAERMEQAKRSFESHGGVRNTGAHRKKSGTSAGYSDAGKGDSKGTKKNTKILVNTVIIIWVISVAMGIIAGFLEDDDEYDIDDIYVDYDYDYDDDYYADDYYYGNLLSDEEYEELLEENGFDEDGYKELDYDEILEAGEPCNGLEHFEGLTSRTAARHIRSALEEIGIEANNYEADFETSNYAYMDYYGDVYTYYESYMYVILGDENADPWEGIIEIISDSVTDEVMEVCVMEDDQDTFVSAAKAVMMELDEECDEETLADLGEVVSGAVEEGVQYSYLLYGNLWFDFTYYGDEDEDFYTYIASIYLR